MAKTFALVDFKNLEEGIKCILPEPKIVRKDTKRGEAWDTFDNHYILLNSKGRSEQLLGRRFDYIIDTDRFRQELYMTRWNGR